MDLGFGIVDCYFVTVKSIKQCKIGPSSATIQNIQINDYDQDYSKEGFNILR